MSGGDRSDEELARLAAGGDEQAFSDLYNAYFPEVYDYAIRISRDRDIAALVLQSAFLRLYLALQSGELPPSIRLHLFAGAHQDLSERLRGRRTPVIEGEEAFVNADASRVAAAVPGPELHDLTRLGWQAARELRPDEYELLDLSVRRGLSDEEIASFVRMRPNQVQPKLDKARATLEDSFSSLVLMNYGRRNCLDLDFLVAEDKWSTSLRRRILQHMAACPVCEGTRRAYITAAEALAAGAVAPAPPGWQAIMLSRLLKAREGGEAPTGPLLPGTAPVVVPTPAASAPAPSVGPSTASEPGMSPYTARPLPSYSTRSGAFDRFADWGSGRGPLFAVFGGGLIILLMVFGALCTAGAFNGQEGGEAEETATGTPTATRTRTPTATMTQTSTSTPAPVPTDTPLPATEVPTEVPPTNTPAPEPTDTPEPPDPTDTPLPPTPVVTP